MRPLSCVLARFASMISADCRSSSTNTTDDAPRLSASIPKAPLPAKRSRMRALITASPKLEKMAALTRSIVGRTPRLGTARRIPPALPAITLMATEPESALKWLEAALPRSKQRRWNCGHRLFDLLLFLLCSILFSTEKAIEHIGKIAANEPIHQICTGSVDRTVYLKVDGRIAGFISGLKIHPNGFEKLATNPVVDRKLGIEFQPAVECDCAGRSKVNIPRAQD